MTPHLRIAALGTAAVIASLASPAPASACTPARAGATVASQPERWRLAVAALLEASAMEKQPWSCTGGVIELSAREQGATLTVVDDDGRATVREVSSPEDVEPLGKALLAKPLFALKSSEVGVEPPAAAVDGADRPAPVASPAEPRVLLSALVTPRYAGGSNLIWGGVTAAAAVPFGPWAAGAWGRYDAVSASLGAPSSMNEVCVGASLSRRLALSPVEVRAGLVPSVAIVTQSHGHGRGDDTRVDGRIGAEVRGALPLAPWLRAVVALDAELAPRELGGGGGESPPGDKDKSSSAPFPAYTVGLGVGIEVAR